MLTPLGKFLRKLRLDNDQLLRDMAERLDMPSSTLSAICLLYTSVFHHEML